MAKQVLKFDATSMGDSSKFELDLTGPHLDFFNALKAAGVYVFAAAVRRNNAADLREIWDGYLVFDVDVRDTVATLDDFIQRPKLDLEFSEIMQFTAQDVTLKVE